MSEPKAVRIQIKLIFNARNVNTLTNYLAVSTPIFLTFMSILYFETPFEHIHLRKQKYIFVQATSSTEVENWIHCIHSSAAMALARRKRMDNIPVLLKKEIRQLREELHSDEKLRKMAQLQLKVEKELSVRQNINMQVLFSAVKIQLKYCLSLMYKISTN